MKRFLISLVSAFSVSLCGGTDNLLRNADFSQWNNDRPAGWILRGGKARCSVRDGVLTLCDALLIHPALKLIPGRACQISWQFRGENARSRVYVEWNILKDGRRAGGKTVGETFRNSDGTWRRESLQFTFPSSGADSVYLVLQAEGCASFRNVVVAPVAEAEALGGVWRLDPACRMEGETLTIVSGARAKLVGVPLDSGKRYALSFRAASDGVSGEITGYHPFRIRADFGGGASLISEVMDVFQDHAQKKTWIFTAPSGRDFRKKADFTFYPVGKGKIRLKEFELKESPVRRQEKYRICLDSPVYRDAIFASMPVNHIAGRIPVDGEIKDAAMTFDGRPVSVERKGAEYHFSFPVPDLEEGTHHLEAVLTTADGKILKRRRGIVRYPRVPGEVTQDAGGRLFADGKEFFPLLLYHPRTEDAMRQILSHGFNAALCTFSYPGEKQLLEILDRARRAGVKLMVGIDFPPATRPRKELERWHRCVEEALTESVRRHPALLGYYLADEPGWGGIPLPVLSAAYAKLRKLDPYHPVWSVEAPRGTEEFLKPYAEQCDIFGIDIYPFPRPNSHSGLKDKNPTCIGKYTKLSRRVTDGRKAVLMVLQGFSWGDYHFWKNPKQARRDPVYPTRGDLRFSICQSLTAGATALAFWGQHYVLRPSFFDDLFAAGEEANRILPFFMSGGSCTPLADVPDGLECYRLRCGNSDILLVMNVSDRPVTAKIPFPADSGSAEIRVYFENRSLVLSQSGFTDTLAPFSAEFYGCSGLPEPAVKPVPYRGEDTFRQAAARRAARRMAE